VRSLPNPHTRARDAFPHELQQTGATVQSAEQMAKNLPARINAAQQVADQLYRRWLDPLIQAGG
jgi:hypothetical protein